MEEWYARYQKAGVPKRHMEFRPNDNQCEEWRGSYQKVKASLVGGGLCVLLGDRGTGKTQSAVCAIGYCCRKIGYNAMYAKAFDVFLSIRSGSSKSNDTTEQGAVKEYLKPHLLVIDAYEVRGNTEFENRTLNHIIDKRYDSMKPTILISNEKPENFIASVGESFVDRMADSGGIIIFKGDSKRGAKLVDENLPF